MTEPTHFSNNFAPDTIDPSVLGVLDYLVADRNKAVPFRLNGLTVDIAVVDPYDFGVTDDVTFAIKGYTPNFVAVQQELIEVALTRWARLNASEFEGAAIKELAIEDIVEEDDVEDEQGQISQMLNRILDSAVEQNASDIHFQPTASSLVVKFRVDGVLRLHQSYPGAVAARLINRVKIASDMSPAEKNKPLDGRFEREIRGHHIDFRAVSLPTAWGLEGVILRLLDRSRALTTLDQIGFHPEVLTSFKKVLTAPNGLILATGPTGSGKTTTLYAALDRISTEEKNTLAIEDPVEIRFPAIVQVQVNEKQGLTFSTALRKFLRADPDIMLVGEIRDEETAALAVQAAKTGHLVLSTLHTNTAAAGPSRLNTQGVSSNDIADVLRAVLAQRLVRKVCDNCKIVEEPKKQYENVTLPEKVAHANPNGCFVCDKVGYKGRLPVSEIIAIDEELSALIAEGATVQQINKMALSKGSVSLRDDALKWVDSLETTPEEIERIGLI